MNVLTYSTQLLNKREKHVFLIKQFAQILEKRSFGELLIWIEFIRKQPRTHNKSLQNNNNKSEDNK